MPDDRLVVRPNCVAATRTCFVFRQIRRSSPQSTRSHAEHWTHRQNHLENANPRLEPHIEGGRVETILNIKQRAFLQTRAFRRFDNIKTMNARTRGNHPTTITETQRRNCSPPDHTNRNRPKRAETILDDIDVGYIYI